MTFFKARHDKTVAPANFANPVEYSCSLAKGLKEKADHNKFESQAAFSVVIAASLAAPMFVMLSDDFIFGKVLPATLSLSAAAATSWLQLRKPQKLWALYRRSQRLLELEQAHYQFEIEDYAQQPDKGKLLAQRSAAIAMEVHNQWEGLVPDPDSLGAVVEGSSRKGSQKE